MVNASIPECITAVECSFIASPGWKIDNINLNISKKLKSSPNSQVVDPKVAVHIYITTVRCVCLYNKYYKVKYKMFEICIGKHIKTILGLSHSTQTTPIFY